MYTGVVIHATRHPIPGSGLSTGKTEVIPLGNFGPFAHQFAAKNKARELWESGEYMEVRATRQGVCYAAYPEEV